MVNTFMLTPEMSTDIKSFKSYVEENKIQNDVSYWIIKPCRRQSRLTWLFFKIFSFVLRTSISLIVEPKRIVRLQNRSINLKFVYVTPLHAFIIPYYLQHYLSQATMYIINFYKREKNQYFSIEQNEIQDIL